MSEETKEKKEKNPMNPYAKKVLLQILGYVLSIAPLAVVFGLKWDTYTATTQSTISLGVGGAISLVLILIKSLGKVPKNIHPIIKYVVALVLVFALDPIIQDLKILLSAAIVGELIDLPIQHQVKVTQKVIDQKATLTSIDNQTQAIVDAINKNQGRV
jgi:hypothetical protein